MGDRKPENRVLSGLSMSAFHADRVMVETNLKALLDMRQPGLFQFAANWRRVAWQPMDRAFSFSI
jgi:hypothetical protein